jgi:hypothetical protein
MSNHTKSEAPSPVPKETEKPKPEKKKREGVKMTDQQKLDLNNHMQKMKKGGMSLSEQRSHRMKMMSRVRKGMSINKAHKDIMK